MAKDFFRGLSAYIQVFDAISRYNLWAFVLLPGLIGMSVASIIGYSAYQLSDEIGGFLVHWYPDNWWGNAGVDKIGAFLGGSLLIALSIVLFKYIMLIVVSPFMSFLSERVEKGLSPYYKPQPFSFRRFSKEFARSIRISLRNIFREIFLTVFLLLLSLIAIIAPITSVLIFLTGAYYAGFGSIDYTLERRLSYRQSIQFIHQHRGLTLGIGTGFMLILFIPIIGVFFAPTFACIAATLATTQHVQNQ